MTIATTHLASDLLQDLAEELRLVLPRKRHVPFAWLEPAYAQAVYEPIPARLAIAYRSSSADAQADTRFAFSEALNRAAASWLGAERVLALVDWIHDAGAKDCIDSRLWLSLLFVQSPDSGDTAHWISGLIRRYVDWPLNIEAHRFAASQISDQKWIELVANTKESHKIEVTTWLMQLLNHNGDLCRKLFGECMRSVRERWSANDPRYADSQDELNELAKAAKLPTAHAEFDRDSATARRNALNEYQANGAFNHDVEEPIYG